MNTKLQLVVPRLIVIHQQSLKSLFLFLVMEAQPVSPTWEFNIAEILLDM